MRDAKKKPGPGTYNGKVSYFNSFNFMNSLFKDVLLLQLSFILKIEKKAKDGKLLKVQTLIVVLTI